MTREEALNILHNASVYHPDYLDALNMAIEALEQETVSKEAYDHEYFLRKEFELKIDELQRQLEEQAVKAESILDKIRAELTEKRDILAKEARANAINPLSCYGLDYALLIIDKYKGESEVEE